MDPPIAGSSSNNSAGPAPGDPLYLNDAERLALMMDPFEEGQLAAAAAATPQLTFTFNPPSEEQKLIVEDVAKGKSVWVNAVAGSGKTTTICHVGKMLQGLGKRALVVTYNARLKEETRERVDMLGLKSSVEVHSFHALGVKYYSDKCRTDEGLLEVTAGTVGLRANRPRLPRFDVVVVDEAQDTTDLLFALVCTFLRDMESQGHPTPQLVVLGDTRQAIYEFKGANHRYLTQSARIWPGTTPREWVKRTLSTSYRLTKHQVDFVNEVLLQNNYMSSGKAADASALPVIYIIGKAYRWAQTIARELKRLLLSGIITLADILIVAPSVKPSKNASEVTPLQALENEISSSNSDGPAMQVECAANDDVEIDPECARGKVLITTYHQAKGLERKVCVVFMVNGGYFRYIKKELTLPQRMRCPNEHYVACTRASERLFVLGEETENDYAPYMDRTRLEELARRRNPPVRIWRVDDCGRELMPGEEAPPALMATEESEPPPVEVDVTRLLRFLEEALSRACLRLLDARQIVPPGAPIDVPITVESEVRGFMEGVAELNGLAIPAMMEVHAADLRGSGRVCSMQRLIALWQAQGGGSKHARLVAHNVFGPLPAVATTPADFLRIAAVYLAMQTGYVSKLLQMPRACGWLTDESAAACMEILGRHVQHPARSEYEVSLTLSMRWPVVETAAGPLLGEDGSGPVGGSGGRGSGSGSVYDNDEGSDSDAELATQSSTRSRRDAPAARDAIYMRPGVINSRIPLLPGKCKPPRGGPSSAPAGEGSPRAPPDMRFVSISGIADVVTDDSLLELKCVRAISNEHLLQLGLYAFMWLHPATESKYGLAGSTADAQRKAEAAAAAAADPHGAAAEGCFRSAAAIAAAGSGSAGAGASASSSRGASATSSCGGCEGAASAAQERAPPQRTPRAFRLVNVLTGETWEITRDLRALTCMATMLVRNYLRRPEAATKSQFLVRARAIAANPALAASMDERIDELLAHVDEAARQPEAVPAAAAATAASAAAAAAQPTAPASPIAGSGGAACEAGGSGSGSADTSFASTLSAPSGAAVNAHHAAAGASVAPAPVTPPRGSRLVRSADSPGLTTLSRNLARSASLPPDSDAYGLRRESDESDDEGEAASPMRGSAAAAAVPSTPVPAATGGAGMQPEPFTAGSPPVVPPAVKRARTGDAWPSR